MLQGVTAGLRGDLLALPCDLIVLLGRPDSLLFEPFPAFFAWTAFAFPGFCAWAAAVAMRIDR